MQGAICFARVVPILPHGSMEGWPCGDCFSGCSYTPGDQVDAKTESGGEESKTVPAQSKRRPTGFDGADVIHDHQSFQNSRSSEQGSGKDDEQVCDCGWDAFEETMVFSGQIEDCACEPGAVKYKQARRNGDAAGPPFAGDEKYQKEKREERKNAQTDIGFPLSHDQNLSMIR